MIEKKEQKKIEEAKMSSKFGSFLDSFLVDVLPFTAALITMIIALVVMYMVCRQLKLKVLVANLALQHTKAIEATDPATRYCIFETNWYIVDLLLIMLMGITYLVMNKIRKSCLFKGCIFSNVTKIMFFISNTISYVPIKLCRIAGSIHLFRIRERLNNNPYHTKGYLWLVSTSTKHDYSRDHSKCSSMPSGTIVLYQVFGLKIDSRRCYHLFIILYIFLRWGQSF